MEWSEVKVWLFVLKSQQKYDIREMPLLALWLRPVGDVLQTLVPLV